MTYDDDDDEPPQLLAAFERYRDVVMASETDEDKEAALLHFMAGATTVVELVRHAASHGQSAGVAFLVLAGETDGFTQAVMIHGKLMEDPEGMPH